jgi:carbonic anhydrase
MSQTATAPAPGRSAFTADLTSGLVVFLVALPLCLGVALASDAPLASGLIAGIVGGLVVGAISGSHTSVAGPAAGLTAVVSTQIAALGSFRAFLTAVTLAGVLQIVLGVAKAGAIAYFVPSSVIKGLLAAIGLILILKQLPHLVGHDDDPSGEMSFRQPDGESTFSELIRAAGDIHPGALIVGIASLILLLAWGRSARLKKLGIPGPLVVVLLGVGAGFLFDALPGAEALRIGPSHLVQVPIGDGALGVLGLFQLPDLSALGQGAIVPAAITIALVASLETLLNLEAVDKLDPQKRVSPPNRELIAQGVGNVTAGLIGGIPVTSVIVRSSVNIDSGGKTRRATIVHGLLLFGAVALIPSTLNRIPLSCLAAILVTTGLKLASPALFKSMAKQGVHILLPFLVTVGVILLTDLLIGVLAGLATAVLFILYGNQRSPVRRIVERHIGDEVLRLELPRHVSFLSRLSLAQVFADISPGRHVMIDARDTEYVDPDVLALLSEFCDEEAPARRIRVSTRGLKRHYDRAADTVQYVDLSTRELQERMSPRQVVQVLADGNDRFARGVPLVRDQERARRTTSDAQHPLACVFSGTSSRTPVEAVFDLGLGDVSVVRTTGHVAGEAVLGSLEYACDIDGAKLLVVMGHTKNEAMRHALERRARGEDGKAVGHHDRVIEEIATAIQPELLARWTDATEANRETCIDALSRAHALRTVERILTESPVLTARVEAGTLEVVGCMYDVESGRAEFFDREGAPIRGEASLDRAA